MRIVYTFLTLIALLVTGYLVTNNFEFNNIDFSNYLINVVLITLLSCLVLVGVVYIIIKRKKSTYRGIMTIKQYYRYKSVR